MCRVLTLLNSQDSQIVVPSDGEALLSWAEKILHKYQAVQQVRSRKKYAHARCKDKIERRARFYCLRASQKSEF